MKIDYLLERYFEGLTTAEDEAALRSFFISNDVPEHLMAYMPLFVHFDDEIKRQKTFPALNETVRDNDTQQIASGYHPRYDGRPASSLRDTKVPKSIVLWLSGFASCAAMLTGFFFLSSPQNKCPETGDYVIIDGRCYTDAATIRSATFKTLHDMAEDGYFLPDNRPSSVMDIVGNQLKEFDFLLDE